MQDEEIETAWGAFAAARSAETFERLFQAARNLVAARAWQAVRDADWTDEVVQALFARLWSDSWRALPAGLSARQAMVRWTLDEARTINRRRWRQRDREAPLIAASTAIDSRPGPDRAAEDRIIAQVVRNVVQTLPEKYREAVIACELDARSLREAAQLLGRPERTVQAQARRGKELLERKLRAAGLTLSAAAALALMNSKAPAAGVALTSAGIMTAAQATVATAGPVVAASTGAAKFWIAAAAAIAVVAVVAMTRDPGATSTAVPSTTTNVAVASTGAGDSSTHPRPPNASDSPASTGSVKPPTAASPSNAQGNQVSDSQIKPAPIQENQSTVATAGAEDGDVWTGRVTDAATGAPIVGAQVASIDIGANPANLDPYVWRNPSPVRTVETDAEGQYRLVLPASKPGMNPMLVCLRAQAPLRAAVGALAVPAQIPGPERRLDFALPAGDSISGKVVNEKMEPVRGAAVGQVLLENPNFGQLAKGSATFAGAWSKTGADGGFVLANLPAGKSFDVPVFAADYPPFTSKGIAVGTEGLTIVLEAGKASIVGIVQSGDTPVAGVSVTSSLVDDGNRMDLAATMTALDRAVTDAQGRFRIPIGKAGHYRLLALSGTGNEQRQAEDEIDVEQGKEAEVVLRFPADVRVSGRAFDVKTNEPIAGMHISDRPYVLQVTDDKTVPNNDPRRKESITGADGRFELTLPVAGKPDEYWARYNFELPAGYALDSQANSFGTNDCTLYQIVPGSTIMSDIPLRRASGVRGILLESDGSTPVANSAISVHGTSNVDSVRTDSAGRFEVAATPGKDIAFTVRRDSEWADATVRVPEKDPAPEARLVLQQSGTMEGVVLTAKGLPAKGKSVQLWRTLGNFSTSVSLPQNVKTDDEGRFEFTNVPPVTVQVRVTKDEKTYNMLNVKIELTIQPGEDRRNVEVRLIAERAIDGVVTDEQGQPLEGISVRAFINQNPQPLWGSGAVKSDAEGYYALDNVIEGEIYDVVFDHPDYYLFSTRQAIQKQTGEYVHTLKDTAPPINAALKRRTGVKVLVIDTDGQPCRRFVYRLLQTASKGYQAVAPHSGIESSAGDGIIDFGKPNNGSYLFQARRMDDGGKLTNAAGMLSFMPADAKSGEPLVVKLRNSGFTVKGRVVMQDGQTPVPDARLGLDPLYDNWMQRSSVDPRFDQQATTDANGNFAFQNVMPSQHIIIPEKDGLTVLAGGWVNVDEKGPQSEVTIKMQAPK